MVSCLPVDADANTQVSAHCSGVVAFIRLRCSHLGASVTAEARRAIEPLAQSGCSSLIIELPDVQTVDSGGLGALASMVRCMGADSEVVLAQAADTVRRAVKQARIEELFSFSDNVATAAAHCGGLPQLQKALESERVQPEVVQFSHQD